MLCCESSMNLKWIVLLCVLAYTVSESASGDAGKVQSAAAKNNIAGSNSPDCGYGADGGKLFRTSTVQHCLATCLGLINKEDRPLEKPCKYHPDSFKIVGRNCTAGAFQPNLKSQKKVFCNFDTISAKDRDDIGLLNDSKSSQWIADKNLCTHILVYPIVKYDDVAKKINIMQESYAALLPHINTFKKARLKVLLTIGSWFVEPFTSPLSAKQFSSISRNEDVRNRFVRDVVDIVIKLELDGVHVRWIYPASPNALADGNTYDKPNFITLLSNFSSLLRPQGMILVADSPVYSVFIQRGVDIPKALAIVDYLFIFATDYGGNWMPATALSTPSKEVRASMETFRNLADDPSKLVLVFRKWAGVFDLSSKGKINTGIGALALNLGEKTNWPWFQAVKKVFVTENGKWQVTRGNNESQSFACDGFKWFSYDDVAAVKYRMELVMRMGFGGVHFIGTFDDDIFNELGCGESPMLRTINEMIRGYGDCILPTCP